MTASSTNQLTSEEFVSALRKPSAYPDAVGCEVEVRETHISWVFLVGGHAYKVKKPIRTSFLDYTTLDKRKWCCEQELRLDMRYARNLYLSVVPITMDDQGALSVEGSGVPIEYAVKMHRFPDDALLSVRLDTGALTTAEVFQLAHSVAQFHHDAPRAGPDDAWGSPAAVHKDARDSLCELQSCCTESEATAALNVLSRWSDEFFGDHKTLFTQRRPNGFIRECHGDLHLANVIHWRDELMPFDGIEFNDAFRWIDVLSDAAFLAMDFAAHGHLELCRSFISTYLEATGDHASLPLLRWYLVYRSLVRAKVAAIRTQQCADRAATDATRSAKECRDQIDLAYRFSLREQPSLWITHGPSGSGKSSGSELVVRRQGAIRLRADVERKRHFGLSPTERPSQDVREKLYCASANHATYGRLRRLAHGILTAGYSVIVDATFLERDQRDSFQLLAQQEGVGFAILDFHSDEQTLRQRVADRIAKDSDASDADLRVLEGQLANCDPLTDHERQHVLEIPDTVAAISSL